MLYRQKMLLCSACRLARCARVAVRARPAQGDFGSGAILAGERHLALQSVRFTHGVGKVPLLRPIEQFLLISGTIHGQRQSRCIG